MAKRFIDTDLFKKRFVRGLKGPYKLLWVYLFCECDNAGIWNVDIEAAELFCGQKYTLEELKIAFAGKIHFFDDESKAFIPDFIEFQYGGILNEKNPAHKAVFQKLEKYQLLEVLSQGIAKPPGSPLEDPAKEQQPQSGKTGRKAFVKPTLEEVQAYCEERKNGIDPQAWIDHYTSNGWKVGKNPMKDWKAAVRTWEKNGLGNGRATGKQTNASGGFTEIPGSTETKTRTSTL